MSNTPLPIDPDELRRKNLAITLGSQPPQLGGLRQPQGPQMAAPGPINMPDQSKPVDLSISHPSVKAPRGTIQGDEAERGRMLNTGAGVDQIYGKIANSDFGQHHQVLGKILGGLAQGVGKLGDIGLSAVAPALAINLPGTEYHHMAQIHGLNKQIGAEEGEQEKEAATGEHQAQTAEAQAKVPLDQAQTEEAQVRAKNLPAQLEATLAEHGYRMGEDGKLEQIPEAELSAVQQAQVEAAKNPWLKEAGNQPLGGNVDKLNQALQARYQVTDPGKPLPPELTLGKDATKADFDRTDKLMEAREKATQGNKTAQQAEADRQASLGIRNAMLALATQREQKGENKTDFTEKQAALKTYAPASDSAERMNVMTDNYEKAVKGDQQAMLSLLSNHIGMTMGLQKGARITQHIYDEAAQSLPWLKKISAHFDDRGYLSGVALDKDQMRSMVNLAQSRFGEDYKKAKSEAQYIGFSDEGPERKPSEATIRYYKGLTGGDGAKAKELAKADGWTVQ